MNNQLPDKKAASLEELEIKKKQLEIEKLELEKNELAKSWYKRPAWWSAIVPFLIGGAGVWIAFSTNIFGIQRLEKEKGTLTELIKTQKDSIKMEMDTLRKVESDKDAISGELMIIKNQLDEANILLGKTRTEQIKVQNNLKNLSRLDSILREKINPHAVVEDTYLMRSILRVLNEKDSILYNLKKTNEH